MLEQKFLPESECLLTQVTSRQDLVSYLGTEINVKPIYYDSESKTLEVSTYYNEHFILPYDEISIYPLISFVDSKTPKEIRKLFSQKILSVKVCRDTISNEIYLSRKENMKDALQYFKDNIGCTCYAKIIGSIKKICFLELGAGIVGAIYIQEISNSYVDSVNIFVESMTYDTIKVKILGLKSNDSTKFVLSYKACLEKPVYNVGDCLIGKVKNYISESNHSGVFVELHPLASGILNTDYINYFTSIDEVYDYTKPYVIKGCEYNFIITKVTPNGYKLILLADS